QSVGLASSAAGRLRIPNCSFGISIMIISRKMIDGGAELCDAEPTDKFQQLFPMRSTRKRSGFVPQARWIRAPEKYERTFLCCTCNTQILTRASLDAQCGLCHELERVVRLHSVLTQFFAQ